MARFPRRARLCKPREYAEAFASPVRFRDRYFDLVLRTPTGQSARLGLAVSRKVLPRAVDRNRVKRVIRESFRAQLSALAGADVVVMARMAARGAEPVTLRTGLDKLWLEVAARCQTS